MRGLWSAVPLRLTLATLAMFGAAGGQVARLMVVGQESSYLAGVQGSISANGRFMAFTSTERLLTVDSNDVDDVYVFDRPQGTLTLESRAPDGSPANGSSGNARLAADGRFLIFDSDATNLTDARDTNASRDIFVRDRTTGVTRRISVSAAGTEANGASTGPVISDDGLVAAFESIATNLISGPDANGRHSDVYLVQLASGHVSRISVDSGGRPLSTGQSFGPSVSADGHIVVFTSTTPSARRTPGPPGALRTAVFVRDQTSGITTCLSCGSSLPAFDAQVSGNGQFVVFTSETGADRWSRRTDIVVHDRKTSVSAVVTRRANASSTQPAISADGRFIVFQSDASNLECARRCAPESTDDNLLSDIYRFDRSVGLFARLSGSPRSWWAPSVNPSVDAMGGVVVFSSRQPVGPAEVKADFNLFVWTVEATSEQPPPGRRVVRAPLGTVAPLKP